MLFNFNNDKKEELDFKKKAFTLTEIVLTSAMLGIIAIVMVTAFKSAGYKSLMYDTTKKKVYTELQIATKTMLLECAMNMKANAIYDNCDKSSGIHIFGAGENELYARYIRNNSRS